MSPAIDIRRALPAEAERLREIASAAKGHWGYDRARVDDWAASLDLSSESPLWSELYVADAGSAVVAWLSLVPRGDSCLLEDLWVDPVTIGAGVGRQLFAFAARRAHELGAATLEWEAEPNAIGFYAKMGGRIVGEVVSSWGRSLPRMVLPVEALPVFD